MQALGFQRLRNRHVPLPQSIRQTRQARADQQGVVWFFQDPFGRPNLTWPRRSRLVHGMGPKPLTKKTTTLRVHHDQHVCLRIR